MLTCSILSWGIRRLALFGVVSDLQQFKYTGRAFVYIWCSFVQHKCFLLRFISWWIHSESYGMLRVQTRHGSARHGPLLCARHICIHADGCTGSSWRSLFVFYVHMQRHTYIHTEAGDFSVPFSMWCVCICTVHMHIYIHADTGPITILFCFLCSRSQAYIHTFICIHTYRHASGPGLCSSFSVFYVHVHVHINAHAVKQIWESLHIFLVCYVHMHTHCYTTKQNQSTAGPGVPNAQSLHQGMIQEVGVWLMFLYACGCSYMSSQIHFVLYVHVHANAYVHACRHATAGPVLLCDICTYMHADTIPMSSQLHHWFYTHIQMHIHLQTCNNSTPSYLCCVYIHEHIHTYIHADTDIGLSHFIICFVH